MVFIWAQCVLEQRNMGEAEAQKYSQKVRKRSEGTGMGRVVGPEAGEVKGSWNEASENRQSG